MQISNALDPGLLDSMSIARTRDTATSAGEELIPGNGEMPPVAASNEIDINAFMKAWGSSDATWDIDENGTVDGKDLGMLLSSLEAASQGDADLQSLLKAWGSDNAQWDLNADGVVNGADLGLYLENGAPGAPPDAVQSLIGFMEAWGTSNSEYDINGDGVVDGGDLGEFLSQLEIDADQATLEQFMSAWGSSDPEWDFNGDGVVDGADLGLLLENGAGQQPMPAKVEHAKNSLAKINAANASRAFGNAIPIDGQTAKAAIHLAGTLKNLGFTDSIPSNLPIALEHVPLEGTTAKAVLNKLLMEAKGGIIEMEA